MAETKSLKAVSIKEIEEAIAKAISALTGTEASSAISSFVVSTDAASSFNGQECFKVELSLRVDKSYSGGSSDLPF